MARLRVGLRDGVVALPAALLLLGAATARAQDDGPRVYQLAPEGAQAVTTFAVIKRGNEEPEVGSLLPGVDIHTNLVVFRYVRTVSLGGRQFSPFVILPTGEASNPAAPAGQPGSETSSGLGDIQIGGVLGLFGSPALPPDAFAQFAPRMTMGLFARVFFPTGAYSERTPINLGSNRFSFQVGLPTTFVLSGGSYRDPSLTALEVFPTFTFYDDNNEPFSADSASKAPLFSTEVHLTRNFSETFWVSGDLLWREGGETTTDGVLDDNGTRGLSGGASAGFVVLDRRLSVILSFNTVIERTDGGPDGWFFRTALVAPF
jgi:hypothetical protein